MIDLASLTALRAVDDHGSVVAAAEALGFTPSAISQQVKRLERQTNVPLLERVGRGVMLTREGRHLVDAGSRLLADLETIESGLHQQAGTVAGDLRIIAFSTAMRGLVAPRVRALRDAHPDLVLSLTEREPWDTVELVATGQADVGVAHSWGDVTLAIPDHLETTSLVDDVADVIVPVGHRLAKRRRVSPHDLVDEGWIATPDGHDLSRVALPDVPRHRPSAPDRPRVAGVPVAPGARRRRPGHRPGAPARPRGAGRRPGRRTRPRPGADPQHRGRAPAQHERVAGGAGGGRGALGLAVDLDWPRTTHTTGEHVVAARHTGSGRGLRVRTAADPRTCSG